MKRIKRVIVPLLLATSLLVSVTGCGKTTANNQNTSDSAAKPQYKDYADLKKGPESGMTRELPYTNILPLPAGPVGDPNKTYVIGFSQALLKHPFSTAQRESVMIEAARHPNIKVLYANTDNDPVKQIDDVENMIAQKVDAILLWPHSVDPLTPLVEKVHKLGIPLIGMERSVNGNSYSAWLDNDYKSAVTTLAEKLAKDLNGKGVIAETSGAVGSSPQILRHNYFVDALKKYPDIKVITTPPTDYSRAKGLQVATDYLQTNPKIDAWYIHSGEIAFGVMQAMKEAGKKIPIYTIDADAEEIAAIQKGEIVADAPNVPFMGDVALRAAVYFLTGKGAEVEKLFDQKDRRAITLPWPGLVTPDNVKDKIGLGW